MLEVSGDDLANLNDTDLRSVVARLAIAELRAKGRPLSSVTAGGNQDAADGGLDVRVECRSVFDDPDFVPRRLTGFQVKKSDMQPADIRKEMRPNGILRDVIRELADASGSYIIVSSQGSVADRSLARRRRAMRDCIEELVNAEQLYTDFYDRDRLAIWINEYPGVKTWVLGRVGRPLSGWSSIGDWDYGSSLKSKPYLSDDKACLIDETSCGRTNLTVNEGIHRLRSALRKPRECIRLVGLSGVGKTRFVQALFEDGVGDDPLDSSIAVYTDYSEETEPTARDMARDLIAHGQRAILVVDNCNPATHTILAQICSCEQSRVSLLTIEYDVRDDEPEQTRVFRLQSASPQLVNAWLKKSFPEISEVDCTRIADFSDGNFRVAGAIAGTLGKGETLGRLRSRDLFERIFHQRNKADSALLQAAEDLSLLYSIDGEDVSGDGELSRVGAIRGITPLELFEALNEMRTRGIVQSRGRFRAVLPQAIANPLASSAINRIPLTTFDEFSRSLSPRMIRSVSRRLGYLHDSNVAQQIISRWLRADGPLGDLLRLGEEGLRVIINVSPVDPEGVLARVENAIGAVDTYLCFKAKGMQWIQLVKGIAYDPALFDRAVETIVLLLPTNSEEFSNSQAHTAIAQLFHISLSGTHATPEQRRAVIRRWTTCDNPKFRKCARVALDAMLESRNLSCSISGFGARSRDFGWQPKTNKDIWDWFGEAIKLTLEIMPDNEARTVLSDCLRQLWAYPTCRDAIEDAADRFVQSEPWIDGWLACRAAYRFDRDKMLDESRARLEKLMGKLKPSDLLNRARAVVLNRMPGGGGWDFADIVEHEDALSASRTADKMAQDLGKALANDAVIRAQFIAELVNEPQAGRAFECGRGIAQGASNLNEIWLELVRCYESVSSGRPNGTVLGGFICEAGQLDPTFASDALEAALNRPCLLVQLPYLQAQVGLDFEGISRLRRAIAKGNGILPGLYCIANRSIAKTHPNDMAVLLSDIGDLNNGVEMALVILHMYILCQEKGGGKEDDSYLSLVGRDLLARASFSRESPLRDYAATTLFDTYLKGLDGENVARRVCENIRSLVDSGQVYLHELNFTIRELFKVQAMVSLDLFLLPAPMFCNGISFDVFAPLEEVSADTLTKWAGKDKISRYEILGRCLVMFASRPNDEQVISPLFLELLEQAPDKRQFLGDPWIRLHPGSWTGSLANIFVRRKAELAKMTRACFKIGF